MKNPTHALALAIVILGLAHLTVAADRPPIPVNAVEDPPESWVTYYDDRRWGLRTRSGEIAIPAIYTAIIPFRESRGAVRLADGWHVIDPTGKIVTTRGYSDFFHYSEGMAVVAVEGVDGKKYGFIDLDGNEVITPKYPQSPDAFREGFAVVWDGTKALFIDKIGSVVADFVSAEGFREGLAPATEDPQRQRWGFIDKRFEFVIEPNFRAVASFSEGLAPAVPAGGLKVGYIDPKGEWVIPPRFTKGFAFEGGFAPVADEQGWYLIDRSDRRRTPIQTQDELFRLSRGVFQGEWFGNAVPPTDGWKQLADAPGTTDRQLE